MNGGPRSDIIERLRPPGSRIGFRPNRWLDHALIETPGKTLNDAADEIERLRALVRQAVSP